MKFGDEIKKKRTAKGYSQKDLAENIIISGGSTLCDYFDQRLLSELILLQNQQESSKNWNFNLSENMTKDGISSEG